MQERSREAEPETWVAAGQKDRRDAKKTAKLPETPKTAEEMWQHSVIGDYLAKYRVSADCSLDQTFDPSRNIRPVKN